MVRRPMRLRPGRAVAGTALSVFQRKGESDPKDYVGSDEGAGGAVDDEGFGVSTVNIPSVPGFPVCPRVSPGFLVPGFSRSSELQG